MHSSPDEYMREAVLVEKIAELISLKSDRDQLLAEAQSLRRCAEVMGGSGHWLGRSIGLGLFAGGRSKGINLYEVIAGLGQAVGELLGSDDRLMLEVYVEEFDRGVARGAGLDIGNAPASQRLAHSLRSA